MAGKRDEGPSIRDLLRSKLPPEKVVDMIVTSLEQALAAQKEEYVACRKCGVKTPVMLPNTHSRVAAAQMILSELEGKVGTQKAPPVAPKVVVGDLSELSDDELLALIQQEVDGGEVDGGSEEEASG